MSDGMLSGRKARRHHKNSQKLRGAGYTRPWRKGQTKRKREEVQDAPQDEV